MLTFLPKPYQVTLGSEPTGKLYSLIGFQAYEDQSLHPVLIDLSDGRFLVVGLYDVQVDSLNGNLAKRSVSVPKK